MKENRKIKDDIISEGVRILSEPGFGRLTQPNLSKRLGLRQSHLTYYFPQRVDLLEAVIEKAVEEMVSRLKEQLTKSSGYSLKDVYPIIKKLLQDRNRTSLVLNIFFESTRNADLNAMIRRVAKKHEGLARVFLNLESSADATIILSTFWGLALQHFIFKGFQSRAEFEKILDRFAVWIQPFSTEGMSL